MENPYQRAVPKIYRREAELDQYVPRLQKVHGGPFDYLFQGDALPRRIKTSAFCEWRNGRALISVLVPAYESPALYEALIHLNEAVKTGVRLHRFSTAFKAYECLVSKPDVELAAIRHAISHPETILSRPKTVEALRQLFGATRIDLEIATHRRIYYRQLGKLLMRIDSLVGDALSLDRHAWMPVPQGWYPAHAAYIRFLYGRGV